MTHKPTGRRYVGEVKGSWNRQYFSFDRGATWHTSKVAAFTAAEASGLLWETSART